MNKIVLNNFNMGGLAESKFSGVKYSMARMVGQDIHSTPALLKANPKSVQTDGGTVNELCKAVVKASNGNIYWFSNESGKIWKQSGSTFTLLHTVSATSGSSNILSAHEHHGYIYYATEDYLHRFNLSEVFEDNYKAFTHGGTTHAMKTANLYLFIGDKNYIHMVDDSGTWTPDALDLPSGYQITALGSASTYLLIGATLGNVSTIFRWNTYSVSFQSADDVWEAGIWSFLQADNYVLVSAGYSGAIYYYNMEGLNFFKRVRGDYSPSSQAIIYPNATGIYRGSYYLFGVSNISGTPTDAGIYSLGRYSESYPLVLNMEYPISQVDADGYNKLGDIKIGALLVDDNNVYWSWKDDSGAGIDKLDYSLSQTKPFVETRVIVPESAEKLTWRRIVVSYHSLPDDSSIVVKYSANYGDWVSLDTTVDTSKKVVYAEDFAVEARTLQVRVESNNTTTAPEIDEITIYVE